jgi:SAM-dependent methyltransferase
LTTGIDYERLYEYRLRGVDQASRQAVWAEIATYVYRRMGAPARVLDPGAGRCEFVNAIPAAERWVVDVLDTGEYRDPEVKAVFGSIMDAELPAGHFDGVFVSNVFEHLPTQDTVGSVLARLRACMEPGGTLAVLGPNFRYCMGEYFDCADHTLPLTHVAIAEHMYAAGFEISTVVPRFLPYSFRGILPPSRHLTRTYLRAPLLWRLFGKQFLVLATKPALGSSRQE